MDDHDGVGVRVRVIATVVRVRRPWGDLVSVADWLGHVTLVFF
jgi:hypothetical protein